MKKLLTLVFSLFLFSPLVFASNFQRESTATATDVTCTDCVTLGSETSGNYAAGDAEAGNALTGDSATAFFSSGTIEDARLSTNVIVAGDTFSSDVTATLEADGDTPLTIAANAVTSSKILDDTILEADLKVVDSPVDEECLTYESTVGDFEWQTCASSGVAGADTQVQFNDGGAFGADAGFLFVKATDQLTLGEAGQDGSLKIFAEDGATDHSTIFQPSTQTQDITYSLPPDDGTSGQFLTTDGAGVLTWTTSAGSGDITAVGNCPSGDCFTGASGTTLASNTDLIMDLDEDNNGTESFQIRDGANAINFEVTETGATTIDDTVTINANEFIDGTTDAVQLRVQGNSTQTSLLSVWEDSATNHQITFGGTGAAIFNESGNAVDFRVESDTQTNMFLVDGTNNQICIISCETITTAAIVGQKSHTASTGSLFGMFFRSTDNRNTAASTSIVNSFTASQGGTIGSSFTSAVAEVIRIGDIQWTNTINGSVSIANVLKIRADADGAGSVDEYRGIHLDLRPVTATVSLAYGIFLENIDATSTANAYAIVTNEGHMIFNENGGDYDVRIEGDNISNLFFLDASEDDLELGGHLETTGTAPSVGTCGTSPSVTASSTDMGGKITVGTTAGGTCTLTFNSTWDNAPSCTVTNEDADVPVGATSTTTTLVITDGAATDFSSDVLMYQCSGQE